MPGRPGQTERNARITRMDAALDAMRPYGFPETMVRETVRELLTVYAGEGHCIEADAYSALIEGLREKQNQPSTSSRKDGDTSAMLIAGPSSGVASSEHKAEAAVNDIEAAESSSQVDEVVPLASALQTLQIERGQEAPIFPAELDGHVHGERFCGLLGRGGHLRLAGGHIWALC